MNKELEWLSKHRKGGTQQYKNPELALVYYRKALLIEPMDHKSFLSLIDCLESLGKEKQAKAILRRLITLFPSSNHREEYLHRLGKLILNQKKKYKKAKKYFRLALKRNSCLDLRIYELGMDNAQIGNYEKAIVCFQSCTKKSSIRHLSMNSLGFAHFHQGKFSFAIKEYKNTLRIKPDYYLAYMNWVLVLICEQKYEESEEMFRKGLENMKSNSNYYCSSFTKLVKIYENEKKRIEKGLGAVLNEEQQKLQEIKYNGIKQMQTLLNNEIEKLKKIESNKKLF